MIELIEKIVKDGDDHEYDNGRFEVIKLVNKFIRTLKITYMSYYGTHKYSSTNRMIKDASEFIRTRVAENDKGYIVEIYKLEGGAQKFITVSFTEGDPGAIIATNASGSKISDRELDYNGAQSIVEDIIDLFAD